MNESLGTLPAPAGPTPPPARRSWQRPLALGLLALGLLCLLVAGALAVLDDGDTADALAEPLLLAALATLTASVLVATAGRRRGPRRPVADPATEATRGGPWGRVPRVVAWALLLGWLVASTAAVLGAERTRDVADLESALLQGEVDRVGVAGDLDARSSGASTVELRWSRHGLDYVALARQVRGDRSLPGVGQGSGGDTETTGTIRGDVTTYLTDLDPSVRVEPEAFRSSGLHVTAFGWDVEGSLAWPLLALLVATLRLVAVSPEPWRATRWGWFWLVLLLLPLGPIAFLLLGGPTGAVRRDPRRKRLGGGWAFVLCVLLMGLW